MLLVVLFYITAMETSLPDGTTANGLEFCSNSDAPVSKSSNP